MAWSAASAVKPHQGSVLTKCPSSAAPPASFVSSRSSMATNAQLPGPLRNFFSQSVISNGLHGMSQRRFPMSCVFVRCDVQPMYEIRRRSSARCTLSLSGFCRRQSDDSTTVALVSEQMRLRRLSLSTSSSDRVLQQMTPSMSRKIIGAEAVDGDMMDDGWNGRGWKKSGPRIFVFAFVFRQRPAAVPTNLASDTRVRTCSETVPKSQPRTGHTREPDPTHLKLKHETTRGTPTHESTHQTDLTHTHITHTHTHTSDTMHQVREVATLAPCTLHSPTHVDTHTYRLYSTWNGGSPPYRWFWSVFSEHAEARIGEGPPFGCHIGLVR